MRNRKSITLLIAALTACASVPTPEEPIAITPGQRVRVTLSSRVAPGRLQGTIVSVLPDTVTIEREEGGVRPLTRRQIDEIEVSVTKVRDPMRAAGYGILAGAPLLVPLAIFAGLIAYEAGTSTLIVILAPAAGLAAVGAIMGGGPQDVWVDASWPSGFGPESAADTTAAEDR